MRAAFAVTTVADNLTAFIYNSRANPYNLSISPGGSTMMLIRHVIRDREPYSMNASATVQDAAEFMAARNVGAVCVVDDGGKLLGVFSERDVLRRVVVLRRDQSSVKV